jgi:hypothetical protein
LDALSFFVVLFTLATMFPKLTSLLLFSGFTICSHAQDSSARNATVYFLRSTGMSGMGAFSAFIDEGLACHLNNNSYSVHQVAPGLHKMQARFDGKKPAKKINTLDIPMEAGQTYYISVDVTNHAFTATIHLVEVTINTARKMMASLKEDKNCK